MIPKSGSRFSEKIMIQQELDQDGDPTKRHPDPTERPSTSRRRMATTQFEQPEGGGLGDLAIRTLRAMPRAWNRFWRLIALYMPKRLYARSLIIVIAPMILLQSVVAFVFMERHWATVTQRLSQATVRDIAAIIDMIETYPHDTDYANIIRIAQDRMQLKVDLLPPDPLPAPGPKPFFSILDDVLSTEITRQINRPFWIDTVG